MYSRGVWVVFLVSILSFGVRSFAEGIDETAFNSAKEAILERVDPQIQGRVQLRIDSLKHQIQTSMKQLKAFRENPSLENKINFRESLKWVSYHRNQLNETLPRISGRAQLSRQLWRALGYKIVKGKTPIPLNTGISPRVFIYAWSTNLGTLVPARPQKVEAYIARIPSSPQTWTPGVPASPQWNGPAIASRFDHES